ncbi:unnamed protein product [Mytilus coruscus]|uniref:B box-type domain-containing protein n=1 Tax=Mytilus coruscus TaxID=42192 RepID=A0A6J8DR65_MYTCO|nr:unnamed protein product [Mytilus coruscus]
MKNAKKWCNICEERFCGECEKSHISMKDSRDLKMISIKDYCQIQDTTIYLNSTFHGLKLDLYCKKHDIAVCVVCVSSEHKFCAASEVIAIDEVSRNAKQSTALSDLEGTILRTLENVKHCINDREIVMENVDKDEKLIRKTIADTRMNLNKYLDELERKMIKDLKSKHECFESKYIRILNQMKEQGKEIENMREQILQMKRFASDLQVFLGTRKFNKTITENIESLKEEIRDHTNTSMELEIHHVIGSLMKEVRQFGEIKVIETKASLQLKDAKSDQAQIPIHESLQSIRNIGLQLKQKFDIKGSVAQYLAASFYLKTEL